ncbi:DUF4145 domain-containing protein [Rhodanobacter sp. DHG33]|nr:DUF4145 domain-containing protein [Rhodanobacter sp. DHG33]
MNSSAEARREWVIYAKSVTLSTSAPENVQSLFTTTINALVYSYFYYPLMTLCADQLLRVVETAVQEKCKQLGAPAFHTLGSAIDWLIARKIIPHTDCDRWSAMRTLRNFSAHPRSQLIANVAMMRMQVEASAELINSLFPEQMAQS